VEGHGDDASVRILLQRIWSEVLKSGHAQVLKAIRWPKSKLVQPYELLRAVDLAALKVRTIESPDPRLILILLDADKDAPCLLGPELLETARRAHADLDIACVVANVEYETWFVASAPSLNEYIEIEQSEMPVDPEGSRLGKGWVQAHFKGIKYSETIDQPRMTAAMDLTRCLKLSPSFAKLCRDLSARSL
jgi:hypothetical protein